MGSSAFSTIHARALERKGGEAGLGHLLPAVMESEALAATPDSRFLAEMARCLFQAGFVWRVINQKWDGFEAVFHSFDIDTLLSLPAEAWDGMSALCATGKRFAQSGTMPGLSMMC
ncbi:MAG TPA: hypothetical protein VKA31_02295 [Mariprofundaceae bacterium]|nr:hypothetical protein [Mariprofundaceae bacterium]